MWNRYFTEISTNEMYILHFHFKAKLPIKTCAFFKNIILFQTVCCGCNVFKLAKIITGIEFSLCLVGTIGIFFWDIFFFGFLVIYLAYLATEYIGIYKKIRGLIIFNFVIRVILDVLVPGLSIYFIIDIIDEYSIFLIPLALLMSYMIFRTWLQFKILKAVKEQTGTELGKIDKRPSSSGK